MDGYGKDWFAYPVNKSNKLYSYMNRCYLVATTDCDSNFLIIVDACNKVKATKIIADCKNLYCLEGNDSQKHRHFIDYIREALTQTDIQFEMPEFSEIS